MSSINNTNFFAFFVKHRLQYSQGVVTIIDKLSEFVRKKRGDLSLREFAQQCDGISHPQIDSIERGVDPRTGKPVRPTIETLSKISKGTGASVAYLAALANGDNTDCLSSSKDTAELEDASEQKT